MAPTGDVDDDDDAGAGVVEVVTEMNENETWRRNNRPVRHLVVDPSTCSKPAKQSQRWRPGSVATQLAFTQGFRFGSH